MNQKRLLLLLLLLFLLFVSTGCEKDVHPTEIHYTGKILYLDRKDFRCHNIIEITGASNKKSLPVGSTIGFYSLDFAEKEQIGNVVHFKILHYQFYSESWTIDRPCPLYVGIIEKLKMEE